jgi:hypothetical protein
MRLWKAPLDADDLEQLADTRANALAARDSLVKDELEALKSAGSQQALPTGPGTGA